MSYGIINQQLLTNIANAIRTKLGVATTYTPAEMPDAIASISGGGITPTGTKNITANGTYDVTNYASAEVAVPTGSSADLGTKSITANGTYTATDDSLDGYSSVTVNVSGGSSGIYSWLPASAELVAQADETINLSADTSWDSITPSTSAQTILAAGSNRAACSYTMTASETENKALIGVAHIYTDYAYTSSPGTAYSLNKNAAAVSGFSKYDLPNYADFGIAALSKNFMTTYVNGSGNVTVYQNENYGIGPITLVFSASDWSASGTTPTVGFTRPAIVARCHATYFSTDAAALIDSANTNIVFKYRIYLVDKADSLLYACFDATNGIIK